MSQNISKLTYQVNLPNPLEIEKYYSPIFSTNDNMFWRLLVELEGEYYGVYLKPVEGPDEIVWGERSNLDFRIFIKESRNNQTVDLYSDDYANASFDIEIKEGCGCTEAFKKSSLRNGELIVGVMFKDIEYKEYKEGGICNYPKPIPTNLINAWKDQLHDCQQIDIEFNVQGEKFYACSSILAKRSEYFANILSGQWAESTVHQNDGKNQRGDDDSADSTNNDDRSKFQIKHNIEITDCESIAFSSIIEYLYTDQVKWTNKDDESIAIKLFCLADKYLLSDLRKRAKIRIIDELNISNVSEIMFSLVPKYEDLKKPVLNFMAENFEEVSNTQEFKDILPNLSNYPNYHVILSEILAEHFKVQNE